MTTPTKYNLPSGGSSGGAKGAPYFFLDRVPPYLKVWTTPPLTLPPLSEGLDDTTPHPPPLI